MRPRHLIPLLLLWAGLTPAQAQNDSVVVREIIVDAEEDDYWYIVEEGAEADRIPNPFSTTIVRQRQFSTHYLEIPLILGYTRDNSYLTGTGAQYSYLSPRWGAYASANFLRATRPDSPNPLLLQATLGATLRPIKEPSGIDWHLYAGLTYGSLGPGCEIGTRFAKGAQRNTSPFSWMSLSAAMTQTTRAQYFTIGLSLELAFITLIFIH